MIPRPALQALSALLLAGTGVGALSAAAQEPVRLNSLLACRDIDDPEERLSCFDRESARLPGAGDLVAVNVAEVKAVERDSFGLELPSLPGLSTAIFGGGDELGLEAGDTGEVGDASQSEPGEPGPVRTADADTQADPAAEAGYSEPDQRSRVLERTGDGQIDRIALAIERVRLVGYDSVFVHMANGQVWEIVEGRNLRRLDRRVSAGDEAVIRRAAMGSYLLRFNGRGSAYRVVRRD